MRAESQEGQDGEQDSDWAWDDTEPEEVAVVQEEFIDPRVQGAEVRINRLPENWGAHSIRRGSKTSEPGSQSRRKEVSVKKEIRVEKRIRIKNGEVQVFYMDETSLSTI